MEEEMDLCYCELPLVEKVSWYEQDAGRRYLTCAIDDCHYSRWIDPPLGARACGAIEGLLGNIRSLHITYMCKMDRLREKEKRKNGKMKAKFCMLVLVGMLVLLPLLLKRVEDEASEEDEELGYLWYWGV